MLTMNSTFQITNIEDASACTILLDTPSSKKRFLRASASFLNSSMFSHLKVFKEANDGEYRRTSQISLRPFEIDNLLRQLEPIQRSLYQTLSVCNQNELPYAIPKNFDVTWEEDCKFSNWYVNAMEGQYRRIRVSCRIYAPDAWVKSTYVQIKLFKEKDGQMKRYSQVNLTLEEFDQLVYCSRDLRDAYNAMQLQL